MHLESTDEPGMHCVSVACARVLSVALTMHSNSSVAMARVYAEERGVSKPSQGRAQLQKFDSEVLNQLNFTLNRPLKELAARREHTEPFVRAWDSLRQA